MVDQLVETCEDSSLKAELVEKNFARNVEDVERIAVDEKKSVSDNAMKMDGNEEQPPAVESEDSNIMARDFYDANLNSYDEGPGSDLPQQHQPGAMAKKSKKDNRERVGVYLSNVPLALENKGVENLCKKFGQIEGEANVWGGDGGYRRDNNSKHRGGKCATVQFATLEDAQSAIRNINDLHKQIGIRASFQRSKESKKESDSEKEIEFPDLPKSQPAPAVDKKFDLEFTTPVNLDRFEPGSLLTRSDWVDFEMLREFDNQPLNFFLENSRPFESITNGRVNYSHTTATDQMTKLQTESEKSFDGEKHEMVHNDVASVCDTGDCKNCGNCSLTFCKGCKDFFCSLHCLKEYKRMKSGCSCIVPTVEVKGKAINRNAVGRGGRLISPSPRRSASSTESDADATTQSRKPKNPSDVRIVKPCPLPLNKKSVAITNVASHQIVFLRSMEKDDNERYLKYLNDVVECSKTAPPLDEIPEKGDIVLAEFEGSYHRALVARIENDEAVVVFLEFGNVEKTPTSNLKKLREDLKYVKRFIFKASLSDVRGVIKTDKCLTYLYQLLEMSVPLKFIRDGEVSASGDIPCELFVSSINESVNEKLNALNNIKPAKIVTEDEISIKQLNSTGSTATLVVIDNLYVEKYRFVTVARREDMAKMFLMHQRIQEYCKEPYEPEYIPRRSEPAEICLVKCKDQWYRASLERSVGDKSPVMLLIDFLVYNEVHISNMRPMPAELKCIRYTMMADIGGITDTTNMKQLSDQLQLLSIITNVKVEQEKVNEPTIHFSLPDPGKGLPLHSRRRQLLSLLQSGAFE